MSVGCQNLIILANNFVGNIRFIIQISRFALRHLEILMFNEKLVRIIHEVYFSSSLFTLLITSVI